MRYFIATAVMAIMSGAAIAASGSADIIIAQTTPPRPQVCTMEYKPVCARASNGALKTYPNACHARADSATIVAQGPCDGAK